MKTSTFRANIVIAVIGLFLTGVVLLQIQRGHTDRRQLFDLAQRIQLGDSQKSVETLFDEGKSPGLRLERLTSDEWLIATPTEFGAVNPVAWIGFSNSTVSSIRLRSSDSKDRILPGAPPDRVEVNGNP